MHFCLANTSIADLWIQNGIAPCLLQTVAFGSGLCFVLLACFQVMRVWKRGIPISRSLLSKHPLFYAHILLVSFLCLLPLIRLSIHLTVTHAPYTISSLLWDIVQGLLWLMLAWLIYWERHYEVLSYTASTQRFRGHSFVALAIAAHICVIDNLCFLGFRSPLWFFSERSSDPTRLIVFSVSYALDHLALLLTFYAPAVASQRARDQFAHQRLEEESSTRPLTDDNASTFSNIFAKTRMIYPYVWPKGRHLLQFYVFVCILLLVAGRVVNVYIPVTSKWIVDSLSYSPGQGAKTLTFRWDFILIYVVLRLCQGGAGTGSGLLNGIRGLLWISVQQYTTLEIRVKLYRHLHDLSLRWHLGRKTGEVLRVMDRGTDSLNTLLSYILFQIAPTFVDIITAVIYFSTAFNAWFGLLTFVTMVLYLVTTIAITEWRTKYRRMTNKLDNETNAKGVDSLLNFETVKYYGNEEFEVDRYKGSYMEYQKMQWKSLSTLQLLNLIQVVIINAGLLAGSLLCAHMVVKDEDGFTVGDYTLFATYIMQLYVPLNWIGTYYRMIQTAFIDMENMFDLLSEGYDVHDASDAQPLFLKQGRVEVRNVCFHYKPERPILKNVSFTVEPGRTVALVGPSGGGKSTIVRLMFRFYDISSGSIMIDGQDIAKVYQKSLRKHIGVVPQDTVLFNESIRYNIRYGRVDADDDLVDQAAQAADIHGRIVTFPDGYDTVVGERGLKLSGGEKQRVAIARTMLKAPQIVLLDEATSALDTQTERNIQAALDDVCAGRTTLIVAHRLSTIIHANQILVLSDGEIIERGTHSQLLEHDGTYAAMWNQQLEAHQVTTQPDSTDALLTQNGAGLMAQNE